MQLNQRLYQLAAEIGELDMKLRESKARTEVIEKVMDKKRAELDALAALAQDVAAPAPVAVAPPLPDLPEPKEGGPDAPAPSAPIDAGADRAATARCDCGDPEC